MVAYVQKENSKHWFSKVNSWITELMVEEMKTLLNWNSNDLLINTCEFKDERLTKFVSLNEKIDSAKISLNHYFLNLN